MSRLALGCALLAGLLAAAAVAGQRVGLALTVVLLLALTAGWLRARPPRSRTVLALAVALAVQPALLDAGWVVAVAVGAALVAGAAAVGWPATWRGLALTAIAPLRLDAGATRVAQAVWALRPATAAGRPPVAALVRGYVLAVGLVAGFGALFVTADSAFAELAGNVATLHADAGDLLTRIGLGLGLPAVAGALVWAGREHAAGPERARLVPDRTELLFALGALVALFAVFVAVQLRVLFGGAAYVHDTTGLGYGEYARQGFVQLIAVAALTLAVVALAARRTDRAVRALLAALCGLTLVVLASALHRLLLVEDAYGLTRVRYGGHAILLWLAAIFVLVLAAGADRRVRRIAPRVALVGSLAGALVFSLSDPDARIARAAVDRFEQRGTLDARYLSGLSADAVPALEMLPAARRDSVLDPLRARLRRGDGVAGLNLSRARARARLSR